MKKFFFFFFTLLGVYTLQAQDETLINHLEFTGGFGGPIIETSTINGELSVDVGGGGALLVNTFFLGGYGMGTRFPEYRLDSTDYNIHFKHGGLWLGYVSPPAKLLHFWGSVKLGWGKARLEIKEDAKYSDRIMALTPEIGIELNVTKFMRISLTGGYRMVSGLNKLPGLTNKSFSSPVGILTFSFGGFSSIDNF